MSGTTFIPWRFYLILAAIALIVVGLFFRIFDLAVLDQRFLRHEGDERTVRLVSAHSFRGMISDRNGFPLAVSTTVYSVWFNPQEFAPNKDTLEDLAKMLEMKSQDILFLSVKFQKKKKSFVYLKRGLAPEIAKKIQMLNIHGLYTKEEYKRFYPEGEVTAHLLGMTNVDDQGQEGLELLYNQWLTGEKGKKWVIKDRLGQTIADIQTIQQQKPGKDIILSIDRRIQYLAHRELTAGILKNHAISGSAIVLDTTTGEVLAMVNQPTFNPNRRGKSIPGNLRNRAVTDTFEPGSTIKAFSVMSALESGLFKSDAVIDTSPGWIMLDGHKIHDEHYDNGMMSLTEILARSSDVGTAKIILQLPPNKLWDLLHRVGFGEITGVGFPGEQSGLLVKHHPWGALVLATMSFGYGMAVTPLQLVAAYSVLANQGVKIPITLLKVDTPPIGRKVLDAKLCKELLLLLESVIAMKGATGHDARVHGYRIAGKTGTSKLVGPHGYLNRYMASFVGIAPLTNPRIIVGVVIRDPQGKLYYGGDVAGPVFAKIMEGSLRLLNVSPDAVV